MTAPPLVTITRLYASGGSEIARLVAETLGWTLIDNEFVDQVARLAGLSHDEVARREERAPGLLERLARTLAVASPEMFITSAGAPPPVEADEATLVKMAERVIAEAAAEGRVVLVGRGAQAMLAARGNALHVYVVASKPWRKRLAIERLGVNPADVDKILEETDRQRDQYVKTYYGRDRQELTLYDMVLNAERLGFEGAAALIVAEVKRRGWT
ncbi:MAG: cytidylate kinase-like family protein [Gemmatimonadales bacterium]